jgi:hypothetical protein
MTNSERMMGLMQAIATAAPASVKFQDLSEEYPAWTHVQALAQFNNGFTASIVCHRWSYGGRVGQFEIAILNEEEELEYLTPVTPDVLGYLSVSMVEKYLKQIGQLPRFAAFHGPVEEGKSILSLSYQYQQEA